MSIVAGFSLLIGVPLVCATLIAMHPRTRGWHVFVAAVAGIGAAYFGMLAWIKRQVPNLAPDANVAVAYALREQAARERLAQLLIGIAVAGITSGLVLLARNWLRRRDGGAAT